MWSGGHSGRSRSSSIIHHGYVLSTNGYITDDFGPVYRAVSTSGGTGTSTASASTTSIRTTCIRPAALLLAPFGFSTGVRVAQFWFVAFNSVAVIIAACILVRLFKFSLTSVALPAPAAGHVLHRIGHQHTGVHQHQRLPAAGQCCSSTGCCRESGPPVVSQRRDQLTLVVKPLLLPLRAAGTEPAVARMVTAFAVPLVFNAVAWPLSAADPMGFVRNTVPTSSDRDHFNSSILGSGICQLGSG